ncbi:MAG: alpha/beta fold hydrolase [Gemmatimonadota bacterium]|nr:alpha/beta fold hydrolase [Gemmatimonadota bacterium]
MHHTSPVNRNGRRRPRVAARLLGGAVLAAGVFQVLRTARRMGRALADYRESEARLRTAWTDIPGIAGPGALRLHAHVREDAPTALPPMVLVHGYGIGISYLVPLAARLAEEAHVYAPDLPGHGPSEHDAHPLTIPELADALAAWMDARELRSALLVGHSIGCQIAAEVAARRPELAAGVVLVGPTSDPEARTSAQQLARVIASSFFERSGYTIWASLDYSRAGASVLREEMRQMVSHRMENVLPRVTAPVRVVRGGRDGLVPQGWAETVARLAGAPEPTVIPGWGHAVHYDDPEAIARIVLELGRATVTVGAAAPGTAPQEV